MDIENIITLIKEVSEAKITNFKIEEGDFRLTMDKNEYRMEYNPVQEPSRIQNQPNVVSNSTNGNEQNQFGNKTVETIYTKSESNSLTDTVRAAVQSDLKEIKSPIVGTFYNSSGPDSEEFVKVGSQIKKGQTLCIIEAMKLMNDIESDYDGEIVEILIQNEQVVEYNQPLFRIKQKGNN